MLRSAWLLLVARFRALRLLDHLLPPALLLEVEGGGGGDVVPPRSPDLAARELVAARPFELHSGTSHPESLTTFAIGRRASMSSSVKNVTALPRRPARPVRPIR